MKKLIVFVLGILFAGNLYAANLPSGYTELEYIEATGTQYIDTGVVMNDTTGIKIVIDDTATNSPQSTVAAYYVGAQSTTSYQGYFTRYRSSTGKLESVWAWNGEGMLNSGNPIQSNHSTVYINYMNDRKFIYNNGSNTYTKSDLPTLINTTLSTYLFAIHLRHSTDPDYAGYYVKGKIYSAQFTNGSNIVANLVPARRVSDGVLGMYDIMDSNSETAFHTNQGSGSFTGGNPVATNCENLFDMSQTPTNEQVKSGVWQRYHVSISSGEGTWTTRHATLTPGTYTITNSSGSTVAYYIYDGTSVTSRKTDRTFTLTIPSEVWFFWKTPEAAASAPEIIIKPESCGTCTGNLATYDSATGTVVQNGTPTPTNPIYPIFYTQGKITLRRVGDVADSYDASTGKITRRVGVKVLNGTEDWGTQSVNDHGIINFQLTRPSDWAYPLEKILTSHFRQTTEAIAQTTEPGITVGANLYVRMFANVYDTVEKYKQWLKDQAANGTPVTVWYPLAEPVEEDWSATRCETGIKIATTKYNNAAFSSVVTALNNAVDTIKTVVANTINQATAVANLQSGKQTMPDSTTTNGTCPNYRQCLLVEDAQGNPYWYEIMDPFYNLFAAVIPNNVSASTRYAENGDFVQLEYIQSNGSQYIDTGITMVSTDDIEIRFARNNTNTATAGFFGYMPSSSNTSPRMCFGSYSSGVFAAYNTTVTVAPLDTEFHTARIYYGNGEYRFVAYDGTTNRYTPSSTEGTMGTAYIFARHGTNGVQVFDGGGTKISYIIWKDVNGNLKAHYVAAKRISDGALGMYDLKTGNFLENQGSSSFTTNDVVASNSLISTGSGWMLDFAANAPLDIRYTVNGTSKCNATSGSANTAATSAQMSNANWSASGNNCWCNIESVTDQNNNSSAGKNIWVWLEVPSGETCAADCASNCAAELQTGTNTYFRQAMTGM